MAHPQESRDKLRRLFAFDQHSLETAATLCNIPLATARRWKQAAKDSGDDWDKIKAAHTMAGGSLEETSRAILAGFLVQYQNTIEHLNRHTDISPLDKAQALASLADSYNKTVAASKKVLPETSELATGMKVLQKLSEFVAKNYPKHLEAFVEILEPFGQALEQELTK